MVEVLQSAFQMRQICIVHYSFLRLLSVLRQRIDCLLMFRCSETTKKDKLMVHLIIGLTTLAIIRQACSSHHQLIFGFASDSICQTQPKLLQILRRQCCLANIFGVETKYERYQKSSWRPFVKKSQRNTKKGFCSKLFSGRFDTSGSLIPLSVSEISGCEAFLTCTRTRNWVFQDLDINQGLCECEWPFRCLDMFWTS